MSYRGGNSENRGPPQIEGMTSLKVDNLTYRTSMEDLRRVFEKYGDIGDVYIPRDKYNRQSRGFAFVRYYHNRDAEDAIDNLDGTKLDGRDIRVQVAKYGRPDDLKERRGRGGGGYRDNYRRRSRSRDRGYNSYRSRKRSWSRERRSSYRRSRSRSRSPRRKSYDRYDRNRSTSRSRSRERHRSRSNDSHRRSGSKSPERYRRSNSRNSSSRSPARDKSPGRTSENGRDHSRSRENSPYD